MTTTFKYVLLLILVVILAAPFLFIENISGILFGFVGTNYILASFIYILLLVASVVLAPFTMPLFLVSGGIFGPMVASIYNIVGWGIGAIAAFLLARLLGRPALSKFVSLKRIDEYEEKIPKDIEFWGIVLLRIIVPVDLLSYFLGFFSSISFSRYTVATFIGIAPFAIIFAYGGSALFEGRYIVTFFAILSAIVFGVLGFYFLKSK